MSVFGSPSGSAHYVMKKGLWSAYSATRICEKAERTYSSEVDRVSFERNPLGRHDVRLLAYKKLCNKSIIV